MFKGPFGYAHDKASVHDNYFVFDTRTGAMFPFVYLLVTFAFLFIPVFPGWLAFCIVIPGVALIAGYRGVEVNLADMQYRDYKHLFHWRIGTYKAIETPKYLLLSSDSYRHAVRYQLHLITEGRRDLVLMTTFSEEDQLAAGREVAKRHGWKLYDNTQDGLVEVIP